MSLIKTKVLGDNIKKRSLGVNGVGFSELFTINKREGKKNEQS